MRRRVGAMFWFWFLCHDAVPLPPRRPWLRLNGPVPGLKSPGKTGSKGAGFRHRPDSPQGRYASQCRQPAMGTEGAPGHLIGRSPPGCTSSTHRGTSRPIQARSPFGGRHSQFRVAGATPRLLLPTHRAGLWHFHRASKCSRPAGTDQTRTPNAASMPTLVKTISVSAFWRGGSGVDVTPRKHLLHGHPTGPCRTHAHSSPTITTTASVVRSSFGCPRLSTR